MTEKKQVKDNRKVECLVYSRVVGYLRPIKNWAKHKQLEFDQRKTYSLGKAIERAKEAR